MRYTYVFKTTDGVRHVDEMDAESREEVFEALRARGIRAIKVIAGDGSKANGDIRPARPVKYTVPLLVALFLSLALAFLLTVSREPSSGTPGESLTPSQEAIPLPRQTIPGNRLRIENAPADIFNTPAEAYLAQFAEPGRDFSGPTLTNLMDDAALMAMLGTPILISADELTEHIDLKRITAGIKREMRAYLRGGHSQAEYLTELVNRQRLEKSLRDKAEAKLAQLVADKNTAPETSYDFWLKTNARLQSMGIYPLVLPDALRGCQPALDVN